MTGPTAPLEHPQQPRALRLHLWWTMVLVLAALGGAGLAVAADRPGNPVERPELTYRADTDAQPWIDHMASDLDAVSTQATALSTAGTNALGSLTALDRDAANTALAAGEQTAAAIATLISGLRDTESGAHSAIDHWRLGPQTVSLFDQIDVAIASAEDTNAAWNGLATTGRAVVSVLNGFDGHDQAVIAATSAGRASRWDDAVALLTGAAADALSTVSTARDQLASGGAVDTLNDLLGRDQAYDAALLELYQYLAGGGTQSGASFDTLKSAVDRAQAALPEGNNVLVVIAGESAGLPIADQLLAMDKARGIINDALQAVSDAKTGGQGTDQTPLETQAPTDAP